MNKKKSIKISLKGIINVLIKEEKQKKIPVERKKALKNPELPSFSKIQNYLQPHIRQKTGR